MKRLLTAAILMPAVMWAMFLAPHWVFFSVIVILAVLCYREYTALVTKHGFASYALAGYGAGILLLAQTGRITAVLPVIVGIAALTLALRAEPLERALATAGALMLGVYYVFGSWSSALMLRQMSPHWIFFAVAINWVGDIAAFFTGRQFGRHKMAPVISPGKSWEGAAGSLAAALLFGIFYLGWALPELSLFARIGLTLAANAAGQVGDLAESAIKRGAGVKDSGAMLPGHGGWLDRLDSTLFSMPVVAALQPLMGA